MDWTLALESLVFSKGNKAWGKDLEGEWGNPTVRFDPKSWEGQSCKGKKFSECPPSFLVVYAAALKSFSDMDVKRALGWAEKNLHGSDEESENPF